MHIMDLMKKTILLVEDEDEIREDLALFLEFSDYEVLQASNGKEAYQLYQDHFIDLMITDIEMPRMNGLELAEKIRMQDSEISILIISGYSDKDKLLRAVKLNLIDYMIKPFTQKSILKTISDIFEKKERLLKDSDTNAFKLNNYLFDFAQNTLSCEDKSYTLTPKQSQVLKFMIEHQNQILSPIDIYYALYPNHDREYSNASIRNIVKRLRSVLPEGVIESIYSEGYKFNVKHLT